MLARALHDMYTYQTHFLAHGHAFLFRLPVFSRSRLRSTHKARLYTTALARIPAGLSGECSGLSKSRKVIMGSLSSEPEPTRPMETPRLPLFLFFTSATVNEVAPQQPSKG